MYPWTPISIATLVFWLVFIVRMVWAWRHKGVDPWVATAALSMSVSEVVFYSYVIGRQLGHYVPPTPEQISITTLSAIRSLIHAVLALGALIISTRKSWT